MQAVNAVLTLNPDVLVIDISMPVLNGLQAAKQLQMANSRAKIIFLTIYEGRDFLDAAFSAGASGYVNKGRLSTDLIPTIHEAIQGEVLCEVMFCKCSLLCACPPSWL
jgi:DNA-binding NarL/FixJ family response regulator